MSQFYTPTEAVEILTQNGVRKVNYPLLKVLLLGILAGMMISFGADAYLIVSHAIPNFSVARMMGAAIFPVGLISIVLSGTELFTGSCMNIMTLIERSITLGSFFKNMIIVIFANAVGAGLFAYSLSYMGQLGLSSGQMGAYVLKLAVGKVSLGFGPALVSGIWCNVLVCLAIFFGSDLSADYRKSASRLFSNFHLCRMRL